MQGRAKDFGVLTNRELGSHNEYLFLSHAFLYLRFDILVS